MRRWALALVAAGACSVAGACPFAADTSGDLPSGHPEIDRHQLRRLQQYGNQNAPDATVPDKAGGLIKIPGGGITAARLGYGGQTTADILDHMAKKSVAAGTGPLCYWSWQSLPPPQDSTHNPDWARRGEFDFAAMQAAHPNSCVAIRDLCTYAVDRLQKHVDPVGHSGVNVLAAVTQGREHATYLCRQGLHLDKEAHPERCAPGSPLYNQSWGLRWPMSVTMWKFDGTNGADVTKVMKEWRASNDQHLPNMQSPAPSPGPNVPTPIPGPKPEFPVPPTPTYPHQGTGWGPGGSVVGKALPCQQIPAAFKYQPPFPQDTSPPGYKSPTGGMTTYLDDALAYWSNTAGFPFPDSSCITEMESVCGGAKREGAAACGLCAALNMWRFKRAGCTSTDAGEFCILPPPPPPPAGGTWTCSQCGHVYDPATDDPSLKNTPFEQLPASWVCPVCGAPKSAYEKSVDAGTGEVRWFHSDDDAARDGH